MYIQHMPFVLIDLLMRLLCVREHWQFNASIYCSPPFLSLVANSTNLKLIGLIEGVIYQPPPHSIERIIKSLFFFIISHKSIQSLKELISLKIYNY